MEKLRARNVRFSTRHKLIKVKMEHSRQTNYTMWLCCLSEMKLFRIFFKFSYLWRQKNQTGKWDEYKHSLYDSYTNFLTLKILQLLLSQQLYFRNDNCSWKKFSRYLNALERKIHLKVCKVIRTLYASESEWNLNATESFCKCFSSQNYSPFDKFSIILANELHSEI